MIELRHKPRGVTSFSLVKARKAELAAAGQDLPIVHGGALDPFAEGLLPLLLGPATRAFELLHGLPKAYVATVVWGTETDTGDHLGSPVAGGDASALAPAQLDRALESFLGWTEQVPPAFSNKRVDGERAHLRARRGETVELAAVRVYVHEARWLAHDLPKTSTLSLVCRGGTYVRSLARDLGRALGCRAHLSTLARTAIGPFSDPGPDHVVGLEGPAQLPWCRSRSVSDDEAVRLDLGRTIARGDLGDADWLLPAGFPNPQAPVRAVHHGKLVALLGERDDGLKPLIDLRDRSGAGI